MSIQAEPKHGGCHECESMESFVLQARTTSFEVKRGKNKGKREYGSIAVCVPCAGRIDKNGKA